MKVIMNGQAGCSFTQLVYVHHSLFIYRRMLSVIIKQLILISKDTRNGVPKITDFLLLTSSKYASYTLILKIRSQMALLKVRSIAEIYKMVMVFIRL